MTLSGFDDRTEARRIYLKLIDQVKSAFMEKNHGDKKDRSG